MKPAILLVLALSAVACGAASPIGPTAVPSSSHPGVSALPVVDGVHGPLRCTSWQIEYDLNCPLGGVR